MNDFYTPARASRTHAIRQQLLRQTQHRQRRLPASVDLYYITDRLLVASQPVLFDGDEKPTFDDTGRDNSTLRIQLQASVLQEQQGHLQNTTTAIDPLLGGASGAAVLTSAVAQTPSKPPEQETPDVVPGSSQVTTSSPSESASFPSPFDLVLGLDTDPSRRGDSTLLDDTSLSLPSDLRSRRTGASSTLNPSTRYTNNPDDQSSSAKRPRVNTSHALASVLDKRHGSRNYLLFSLTNDPPDDRTLTDLRRQIVKLSWTSPGLPASETPTIPAMLDACYAIAAWLGLDQVSSTAVATNITPLAAATATSHQQLPETLHSGSRRSTNQNRTAAVVYCANGKSRSAIVVACYLKFSGIVETTRQGFCLFYEHRCPDSPLSPNDVFDGLPPSLHTFFHNFDDCLNLKQYINTQPLLLQAIALQGIPVEDKPCLDLWNQKGEHIYSSHPELFDDLVPSQQQQSRSQWLEEEGFYLVNQVVHGDFCLLCRFGGPYAQDIRDTSKIIFRYANTTGFLGSGGALELTSNRVDIMRRYAHLIDGQDFLLSLMWEASWMNSTSSVDLAAGGVDDVSPPVLQGYRAMERGWEIITKKHAAQPDSTDLEYMLQMSSSAGGDDKNGLVHCPNYIVSLALQLSNFVWDTAEEMLYGRLRSFWSDSPSSSFLEAEEQVGDGLVPPEHIDARDRILSLVQETDILSSIAPNDQTRGGLVESTGRPRSLQPIPSALSFGITTPNLRYASPAMQPRSGDIVNAFGLSRPRLQPERPMEAFAQQPALPMLPRNMITPIQNPSPISNPENQAAVEILMALNHAGVSLRDLLALRRKMTRVGDPVANEAKVIESSVVSAEKTDTAALNGQVNPNALSPAFQSTGTTLFHDEKAPTNGDGDSHVLNDTGSRSEPPNPLPQKDQDAAASDSSGSALKVNLEKMLQVKFSGGSVESNGKNQKQSIAVAAARDIPPGEDDSKSSAVDAEREHPLKDDPCFSKYYKMLTMKLPRGAVENAMVRDGADVTLLDLDPAKSLKSQRKSEVAAEEGVSALKDEAQSDTTEDPPLKDDPCFSKYFKMLTMKLPRGAVENAMTRDGADVTLLDLDPEKSLKSSRKGDSGGDDDGPPLKDDPCFAKYYKMLKMKLPRGAVENAMARDGADASLLDLDPEMSLKSQRKGDSGGDDDGPPLKDDPCFAKYYKMLKMKLPRGAVENAMARDGADASLLDLDPERSLKSQRKGDGEEEKDEGPPLKDDPCFAKYDKMLKMNLPRGAVENAMARDGADASLLDLDPEKSLKSQRKGYSEEKDDGPPLKDDPCFAKYYKMLSMKLPRGAVENAMARDGADVTLLDLDPEKSLNSQRKQSDGPPLKDDPCFAKYYKMLQMKLPRGAVENAMVRDGADVTLLDLDPEKSLMSQREKEKDDGPPLKDDPCFSKYYKMLHMKLPRGAVENAMVRDGADVTLLDLDPEKSLESQRKKAGGGTMSRIKSVKKKKRVRRKKIYWNPIDPREIKEDSLWSIVKGRFQMNTLDYDVKEFEDLFTESAEPGDKSKEKKVEKPSSKKSVQVIDGKRSMNGGIILKRLKMDNKAIAQAVDAMEHDKLDSTSMKALKELLPTHEERKGLTSYLEKAERTGENRSAAFADLSECEKYMVTIMEVSDAAAKFDCMLFRDQFRSRYDETVKYIRVVEKACDEVRTSEKLQKIIAIILTLVNEINTGGDGNEAAGFNLDALLKLNEAKAFDRKTSVLHYLAKLVRRNDESLLDFHKDLAHVAEAENIIMDSLFGDIKALKEEVGKIHETVIAQAEALEETGESKKLSLRELQEQKSSVRVLGKVPQYNKIDHHTGRTPMERFTLRAAMSIDNAVQLSEDVKEKFSKLLEYFGEDEKMASNEFFGTMKRFIAEFGKAVEQVEKEEKNKLKEEKKAAKNKANAKPVNVPSSNVNPPFASGQSPLNDKWPGVPGITVAATGVTIAVSTPTNNRVELASPSLVSGVAAVAAAAKQTAQENVAPSGIAAMAAAAAAKKAKQTAREDVAPTGIAAMAATAAKKQAKPTSEDSGAARTGIAAMAAAAAAKKQVKPTSEDSGAALTGIAAMAAAAAAKKQAKPTSEDSGAARTGIAAMAAAAAKKQVKKPTSEDSGVALTGIAAMAAAAAAKKQAKPTSEDSGAALTGIAAMAAAAAAKKQTKQTAQEGVTPPGIAAMAAAAAAKKQVKPKSEVAGAGPTGIAAMAAAAARKQAKPTSEDGCTEPTGIAAMAAAAAAKKQAKPTLEDGGAVATGIAAMAAAAAARKQAKPTAEDDVTAITGIAAMSAAEAAMNRMKHTVEVETQPTGMAALAPAAARKETEKHVEDKVPPTGIAAMAAAAAAAIEQAKPTSEDGGTEPTGIAAMAAAAAAKKQTNQTAKAEVQPAIAAMAAKPTWEESGGPPNGVATMAAAAAAKKKSEPTSEHGGDALTGIAAVAASAAAKKQAQPTSEDGGAASTGLATALAEANNHEEQTSHEEQTAHDSPTRIAAMAATAAKKKAKANRLEAIMAAAVAAKFETKRATFGGGSSSGSPAKPSVPLTNTKGIAAVSESRGNETIAPLNSSDEVSGRIDAAATPGCETAAGPAALTNRTKVTTTETACATDDAKAKEVAMPTSAAPATTIKVQTIEEASPTDESKEKEVATPSSPTKEMFFFK